MSSVNCSSDTTIDAVISDRPVLFMDETAHGAWVNSKALELAGIDADTPQPASGVIGKDPNSGEPTGYLADGYLNLTPMIS